MSTAVGKAALVTPVVSVVGRAIERVQAANVAKVFDAGLPEGLAGRGRGQRLRRVPRLRPHQSGLDHFEHRRREPIGLRRTALSQTF
jgi:hypothetical protein